MSDWQEASQQAAATAAGLRAELDASREREGRLAVSTGPAPPLQSTLPGCPGA